MTLAYAPKGLFGVLTPQANTTAEPELIALTPKGYGWITGRMTSPRASMEDRLADYFANFDQALTQFANAPVEAVAVACTGASYVCGAEEEAAMVARVSAQIGAPVITSALAVIDALQALGARRIGVVSPYNAFLTASSCAYWSDAGFTVAAQAMVSSEGGFHPTYVLGPEAAGEGLSRLPREGLDAALLLGTGMPTLRAIRDRPHHGGAPVLSSILCTAWRTIAAVDRRPPNRADLMHWVHGTAWGAPERVA